MTYVYSRFKSSQFVWRDGKVIKATPKAATKSVRRNQMSNPQLGVKHLSQETYSGGHLEVLDATQKRTARPLNPHWKPAKRENTKSS